MSELASEDHNDQHSGNTPTPIDHSVDELAKGLAIGTVSRRKALRMLGAALVGATLASIPGAAWAACRPLLHKCTGNFQCCSRNCIKNPQGNGRICGCPTGKTLCGGRCVTNCTAPKVPNPTNNCACECPANLCTAPKVPNPTNNCACKCPNTCTSLQVQNQTTCACETCPSGTTPCVTTCCPSGEFCDTNLFAPGQGLCCPNNPENGFGFCRGVVTTGGEFVCANFFGTNICSHQHCTTNADCASGQYCIRTSCDIVGPGGRCNDAC